MKLQGHEGQAENWVAQRFCCNPRAEAGANQLSLPVLQAAVQLQAQYASRANLSHGPRGLYLITSRN